ncbi:hypothetical protein CHUAL_007133 [Chamberlinius hualienensis]
MYCRLAAKELSVIQPQLAENNVRFIGFGFDEDGLQEFLDNKYFSGEIYLVDKSLYAQLKFKRYNMINIFSAIFSQKGRQAISKGREAGVGNNFKGDGMQNGGVLVVSSGGSDCLLAYKQEHAAEHVETEKILKSLGLGGPL